MKASTVAKKILKWYGDDASKWCQGAACRDENGVPTYVYNAKSCCMFGAVSKLSLLDHNLDPFRDRFRGRSIIGFNDKPGRTFAQVKRKLQKIAEGDK